MKTKMLKILPVILYFLGLVSAALAQPLPNAPGPGGTMPGSGAPTVNCQTTAPIEDGIGIILILAVFYVAYHSWQLRKHKKTLTFS